MRLSHSHITDPSELALYPDPAHSQWTGFGDYWAISWLCWVSSINFLANTDYTPAWCKAYFIDLCTRLDDVAYFIGLSKIKSVDSEQLNSHQTLFLVRGRGGWGLEDQGWQVEKLFDGMPTLPTHPATI